MLSLSDNNQADFGEAFKSSSRYLDDLFNINAKFGVFVNEGHSKPPTLYCLPKLYKILIHQVLLLILAQELILSGFNFDFLPYCD